MSNPRTKPDSWIRSSMRSAQRYVEGIQSLHLLTPDIKSASDLAENSSVKMVPFMDKEKTKRWGIVPAWLEFPPRETSLHQVPLTLDHYWDSACNVHLDTQAEATSRLPPARGILSLEQIYSSVCKKKLFPIRNPSAVPFMLGKQASLSEDFVYVVSREDVVIMRHTTLLIFVSLSPLLRKSINSSPQHSR